MIGFFIAYKFFWAVVSLNTEATEAFIVYSSHDNEPIRTKQVAPIKSI